MSGGSAPIRDPSAPPGQDPDVGRRVASPDRGPGPPGPAGTPAPSRLAASVRLALGGLLIGSVVLIGCSEQTRHKVLSFFFDGVPAPGTDPGEEPITGEWGELLSPDSPEYQRIKAERQARQVAQAGAPGAATAAALASHVPYRDRNCAGCHRPELVGLPIEADATLCSTCHADHTHFPPGAWVHGPTALGKCGLCHEPHESAYAHLLTEPMPKLCLDCHVDPKLLEQPYHRAAAAGQALCTRCHDPHMAANRLLLVDSGSYARRRPDPALASGHTPYRDRQCQTCHTSEQALQVRPDINDVCVSCHQPVLAAEGPGVLHAAVSNRQCVTCHEPHQSPLPHLVRPTAEKMCFACHTPAEIRTERHPAVERADCLLCHHGHRAQRPSLLREGAPAGETGRMAPGSAGSGPSTGAPSPDEPGLGSTQPDAPRQVPAVTRPGETP